MEYITVKQKKAIAENIIERKINLLKNAMEGKAFEIGCSSEQFTEEEFLNLCRSQMNGVAVKYIGTEILLSK